jgi:hypothetical protein
MQGQEMQRQEMQRQEMQRQMGALHPSVPGFYVAALSTVVASAGGPAATPQFW